MKPFDQAKPIILGLMLFLILNTAVTAGLRSMPAINQKLNAKVDNNLPQKLALLQEQQNRPIDVLALGTSQTNNDFSTAAFEGHLANPVNSFNMGLPGTRYDVMQTYLEDHIHRYGRPKLIVLEVTDALAENKTVYFYLPALHYNTLFGHNAQLVPLLATNPLVDFNVKKEVLFSSASIFYQFRPLFTPISVLKKGVSMADKIGHLALGFAEQEAQASPPPAMAITVNPQWVTKGWSPRVPTRSMATAKGIIQNAKAAKAYYLDSIEGVNFAKLRALLTYCRQQNIPVVLVNWPSHPAYRQAFATSSIYRPYQNGLYRVVREYQVPLIDFNQEPASIQDNLYADTRHLNPKGARLFSEMLADRVDGNLQKQLSFSTQR